MPLLTWSNGMTLHLPSFSLLVCIGCVLATPVVASTDTLQPFVFAGIDYNSNLLRFSSAEEAQAATGVRQKDTLIKQYGVGLNVALPVGRQQFTLSGQVYQSRYSRYDFLDHNGGSASSSLSLDITRYFKARLGGEYSRRLSSFDYLAASSNQAAPKDIRINSRSYAEMTWLFSPDWSMELSVDQSNNDFSLPQQRYLVREQDSAAVEFRRNGNEGSYLGVGYKSTAVNYPDRPFDQNSLLDNGFRDHRYFLAARLAPKPYARVDGRVATVLRRHDHLTERDFTTHEASLGYQHEFSNAVSAKLLLGRDVSGVSDARSNYITRTSSDLDIKLPLTSRVASSFGVTGTLIEYHDSDVINQQRMDGLASVNAGVSYEMAKNAVGSLGAVIGYRNSTDDQFDYRYNMLSLKVQATF